MSIIYDYYTGWPSQIISDLKRSITQYLNNNCYVKIGITNDPERRWNEHKYYDPSWDKMVAVYESSSLNQVRYLESELIKYEWKREELWNSIGGGGGNFSENTTYFLYLLIQRKDK